MEFGSVAGLEISGAVFFLGEPARNGWESPEKLGITSARVEVFCDYPDTFIARAVQAGANGSFDKIKNHEAPLGYSPAGRIYRSVWAYLPRGRQVAAKQIWLNKEWIISSFQK